MYKCYNGLPIKLPLTNTRMLNIHSAMDHNLQPVGISNYRVTIGGASVTHSFIGCKHHTKDLVMRLDVQQIVFANCVYTRDVMSLLNSYV